MTVRPTKLELIEGDRLRIEWSDETQREYATAELRDACLEISGERAKLPAVGEAYAEARRAAGSIGAYQKPTAEDFSHAIVHRAAIQCAGSWRRWCLTDDDSEMALRARFFQCYDELRKREITRHALPESARQLTAEESRQSLADVYSRAEAPRIAPADEGRLKPIHELMKSAPPTGAAILGDDMTDAEWWAKKAAILEGAL